MRPVRPWKLFALALLAAPGLAAQQSSGNGSAAAATATAVTGPSPVVDGRLDEQAWAGAQVLSGFVQMEPTEGRPVSETTEVRVVHDQEALYVGAWLYDRDPSAVVFGQTLRDASLNDADAFVVVLDTYLDRQNGFVFGTTPAGIEFDGQVTNEGQGGGGGNNRQAAGSPGGFNVNWDGSWTVATSTDERGWYAEMRIPFATLRYGSGGAQTWGVNFERKIRRNNEQAVWAPVPRQFNLYRVSLARPLELSAPTKRIVTVSPYVLGDAFKDYTVTTRDPSWDSDPRIGGDAKIGLSQSLTLDLTVNTDFAQAEVDDQQVNLTRFSLFFPEKRAFFLENAGTFGVGASQNAELFFSRRIGLVSGQEVPIHAGARVTGKLGGVQVGMLNIQTGDHFASDPVTGVLEQVAPNNNFGVVRAFQEFENRTRVGGIVVSRLNTDDGDDWNLAYGVDGRLGIGQGLTFEGWAALTETALGPGVADTREGFNGGEYGYSGGVDYLTRDWELSADYRQVGAGFNPEVGFVNRREYRYVSGRALWHWRTPNVSWFREFRPHVSWNQYWTLDGFSETYMIHIDNHFQFENGAFFQLPGLNVTGEGLERPFEIRPGIVIPPGSYDNLDWQFRANTNRSAPLSLSAGWEWGGFYSGTRFGPNAQVSFRHRDRFTTSFRVNYFDVDLNELGSFTTSVVGLNASYSFTPRLYVQANVQYNDDTQVLGTNLRMGWLDTAGTGLFIVFNDSEYDDLWGDDDALGSPSRERRPLQRQFVIKYSRLFDLTR